MGRLPRAGVLLVVVAGVVAAALVVVYAALGGGDYEPMAAPDPCAATWEPGPTRDADEAGQRIARLALAQAACRLGTTREDLVLGLAGEAALQRYAADAGVTVAEVEGAVRAAVDTATQEGARQGAIDADLAEVLAQAVAVLPLDRAVRTLDGTADPCEPLPWKPVGEQETAILAQVVVGAFQRTSCALGADPLDVLDALTGSDGIAQLAAASGKSQDEVAEIVQTALQDELGEATDAGDLTPDVGSALEVLVEATPVPQALAILLGDASACDPIPWRTDMTGLEEVAAQVGLRAITSTSCTLKIPVTAVAGAIAQPGGLAGLAQAQGLDPAAVEAAARDGLRAGLEEAKANDAVSSTIADALTTAIDVVPVDRLLATLRGDDDPCAPVTWIETDDNQKKAAQIVLVGLAQGACTLSTSTARLAEALASEEALDAFAATVPGGRDAVESGLRAGLQSGIDLAEENDAFGTVTAFLLGQVVQRTPLLGLLDTVRGQVG